MAGPECDHCYALDGNRRFSKGANFGPGAPRKKFSDNYWKQPTVWNAKYADLGRPFSVFSNSVGDVFDIERPTSEFIRLWRKIGVTPNLLWTILTKRHKRIIQDLPLDWGTGYPNVMLGVSAGTQKMLETRWRYLQKVPAAGRFMSLEPILEELDISEIDTAGLDWVIIGGESGVKARVFELDWARKLIADLHAKNVPVFVKQLGTRASDKRNGIAGRLLKVPDEAKKLITTRLQDYSGSDPDEWPADLRVQQYSAMAKR